MNEKPLAEELGRADDAIYFLDVVGGEQSKASVEVRMPTPNREQIRRMRRTARKRKGYTR